MAEIGSSSKMKEAADALRSTDSERWFTLCRMHLSFLLDLKDDRLECVLESGCAKSNSRTTTTAVNRHQQQVNRSVSSPPSIGSRSTLGRTLVVPFRKYKNSKKCGDKSEILSQDTVKRFEHLINFLNKDENLRCQGIFRKSGKVSRQDRLKARLSNVEDEPKLNLELLDGVYTVHDCATVLKNCLTELAEPLLTEAHYPAHCQIPDLCHRNADEIQKARAQKRQIQALQLLFQLLPPLNRKLLKRLLNLLHRVSLNCESNLMDSANLGTLFSLIIMCPRKMCAQEIRSNSSNMSKAVAFMIENAAKVFDVPDCLVRDAAVHWQQLKMTSLCSNKDQVDGGTSVDDDGAVRTCITFCERRNGTATAGTVQPEDATQHALAELYAYIQTLPDSGLKKKYIKQMNKENGLNNNNYNNPDNCKHRRSRSVGASLKKHLFRSRSKSRADPELLSDCSVQNPSGYSTPVSLNPSGTSTNGSGSASPASIVSLCSTTGVPSPAASFPSSQALKRLNQTHRGNNIGCNSFVTTETTKATVYTQTNVASLPPCHRMIATASIDNRSSSATLTDYTRQVSADSVTSWPGCRRQQSQQPLSGIQSPPFFAPLLPRLEVVPLEESPRATLRELCCGGNGPRRGSSVPRLKRRETLIIKNGSNSHNTNDSGNSNNSHNNNYGHNNNNHNNGGRMPWQLKLQHSKAFVSICNPWFSPEESRKNESGKGTVCKTGSSTVNNFFTSATPKLTRFKKLDASYVSANGEGSDLRVRMGNLARPMMSTATLKLPPTSLSSSKKTPRVITRARSASVVSSPDINVKSEGRGALSVTPIRNSISCLTLVYKETCV